MTDDYLEGRGRVRVKAAGIAIDGVSIAGRESFYKLPGFRTLLEFGRAPEDTVSYATVCLTHGHLDHAAGLAHHASRRRLDGMSAARVFAPEEVVPDLEAWLTFSQRLEKVDYGLHVTPATPGASFRLRNDLELKILPGRHRVPTVGYLFSEIKHKLRDEFLGLPGERIAALRAQGVEVTRRQEIALLAYPGDCAPAIFDAAPEIFLARVLLIECSFVLPEDRERARTYAHLHLDDLVERASEFRNEAIVLTHFSQRYPVEEIRRALQSLPDSLTERVIAFLA
ncbi:MAG TPA: MBL fold metallo-hydrolase [Thermoanaerobaculia bacterium]|nr:MBL fold metallo-hydrolase [Thermoanaerobaculia bacterium]